MTIYGIIFTAIARKISAVVAEIRKLVAEAKAVEVSLVNAAKAEVEQVITTAETEAKRLIAEAKSTEKNIVTKVDADTAKLRSELVDKIAKL